MEFDYNRHLKQAADLPAKVAKRIGCAYKRDFCVFLCQLDCSLEIGWSPIFVKILGHNEFLVINSWSIFMSPFHTRQLILPCARRGHVIFEGKFHEWTTLPIKAGVCARKHPPDGDYRYIYIVYRVYNILIPRLHSLG